MSENETHLKQGQLNIQLDEAVAHGIYSNLAVISHSPAEFVIDFIRVMPGVPKSPVKSRIIIAPEHAKRLLAALQDNIMKYEAANGFIKTHEGNIPNLPSNFGISSGTA